MKKIWIADDDEDILAVVELILADAGFEVSLLTKEEEFWNNSLPFPDVILLDVWMSGLDGREVCKMLKKDQRMQNVPVVLMSASEKVKTIAEEAGADGFIEKPFEMSELILTINAYAGLSA